LGQQGKNKQTVGDTCTNKNRLCKFCKVYLLSVNITVCFKFAVARASNAIKVEQDRGGSASIRTAKFLFI